LLVRLEQPGPLRQLDGEAFVMGMLGTAS
jgi:hypothetical protein